MSELSNILDHSVARFFAEQIDHEVLKTAEADGWAEDLWKTVRELGITEALVSEANGGMGGSWSDAFVVARLCGYAAAPLPITEHLVAAWLAEKAELKLPDGPIGLITEPISRKSISKGNYDGSANAIPWGRHAQCFLGITDTQELVAFAREGVDIACAENLGREPRDNVSFNATPMTRHAEISLPADAIKCLGAMLRSAQIAGAGERCLEIAVQYVGEREQFGRSLSKFQAIQHHLALMASALSSVEAMSATAFKAMDELGLEDSERDARFEIAAAKCRASDAVESLTRIAHQVHGAIGFTDEYGLHYYTKRLWSWRAEFGTAGVWAEYLGGVALRAGGDGIWAYVTN